MMEAYLDWDLCAEEQVAASHVNDGSLSFALQERPSTAASGVATSEAQEFTISVSTIFFPDNPEVATVPDSAVKSSDGVLFYLNTEVLSTAGAQEFPSTPIRDGWHITPGPVSQVPESSGVLTVILCAVYGISCESTAPSLDDISSAIDRMPLNGLSPKALIHKGSPLYTLLMTRHAPFRALTVYTIAAHHEMELLAQDASAHLLALEASEIDDASAVKMGSSYLMRLILLNITRVKSLREIVRETIPALHPVERGRGCNKKRQQEMRSHWLRTVTQLTWEAKSDMSPSFIRQTCHLAAEDVPCSMCRKCWNDCVEAVVIQWVQVKFTI